MYSIVWCFSVRRSCENARISESLVLSSCPKMESKWRACSSQDGFLVSGASGESAAGGSPARKRAVSSGVAVSALRAGATVRASALVTSAAAVNLSAVESIDLQGRCWGNVRRGNLREQAKRVVDHKSGQHY